MLISTLSNLAVPALFGRVIDSLTADNESAEQKQANSAQLYSNIYVLLAVTVLGAIFSFLRGYLFALAGERVVARLRKKLFHALMVCLCDGRS